jgi:predicted Zn finger-like uncharacterized protein
LFTQCPHCETRFRIRAREIRRAAGKVHCGQCNNVFNAIETLYDGPDARFTGTRGAPAHADPLAGTGAAEWPDTLSGESKGAPFSDRGELDGLPFEIPADLPELEPATREPRAATTRRAGGGHWAWGLGAVALLLLALGQVAWQQRATLLSHPQGRALLDAVCSIAGCELPLQSAPELITIERRSIASHPDRANALRVSLVFVNRAAFTQRYPTIELSFFDARESLVARRRFEPREYLDKPAAGPLPLKPGEPVEVVMDLEDPGQQVTGFRFDFF